MLGHGLERICPRKGCPWPWIFFVSLASSLVSSTPPLLGRLLMCILFCVWIVLGMQIYDYGTGSNYLISNLISLICCSIDFNVSLPFNLFITSNSSYFFNKADFEQYLFSIAITALLFYFRLATLIFCRTPSHLDEDVGFIVVPLE